MRPRKGAQNCPQRQHLPNRTPAPHTRGCARRHARFCVALQLSSVCGFAVENGEELSFYPRVVWPTPSSHPPPSNSFPDSLSHGWPRLPAAIERGGGGGGRSSSDERTVFALSWRALSFRAAPRASSATPPRCLRAGRPNTDRPAEQWYGVQSTPPPRGHPTYIGHPADQLNDLRAVSTLGGGALLPVCREKRGERSSVHVFKEPRRGSLILLNYHSWWALRPSTGGRRVCLLPHFVFVRVAVTAGEPVLLPVGLAVTLLVPVGLRGRGGGGRG